MQAEPKFPPAPENAFKKSIWLTRAVKCWKEESQKNGKKTTYPGCVFVIGIVYRSYSIYNRP